jgi:drug/metabolite transporter (DMT)-like permease
MVGVRQLAASMSVFEMLTLRSAVAFCILLLFARYFANPTFKSSCRNLHLTRNICHFAGQYCWAVGVILLPLAEVIAIEFTTPIWAVLLVSIFLHEKLTAGRIMVLVAGLVGVLIIVRPGFQQIQLGTAVAFMATFGFALTSFVTKKLTTTESVWTILIYMSALQFLIGIIPSVANWVWPIGLDWFWIFQIGICGLVAHLGLTKALSIADAATILPLDYLRLPATFFIGYLFYNESLDSLVLLGASIIFVANYLHLRQESKGPT